MKRLFLFCLTLTLLVLASCGTGPEEVDKNPDVAISKIDGPLTTTPTTSGGTGGTQGDTIDLLAPRSGPPIIAASELFDPVTETSSANPLSVYVTASDELGVVQVELFYNGTSVGTRTKEQDGIQFRNPFVFPNPRSGQSSVPVQGETSGLLGSQLRAVATDSAGQVTESEVVNLQADGSRPNLDVSVQGDGTPGPVSLSGQASDPETGITSFQALLDGSALPLITPTSFSATEEAAGTHTLVLSAVNGVGVTNETRVTFVITEPPPESTNTPPTVTLTANPSLGDAPLAVIFTATAQDAEEDPLTYAWDFGNGATASSGNTQSTTYAEDGTYTATVTVSDGVSEVVATTPVIVGDGSGNGGGGGNGNEAPTVVLSAAPATGDAPLEVTFSAVAEDPEGDTLNYVWMFGNGDTDTGAGPKTVTYTEDGTYTATVSVDDGNGGATTAETIVVVGDGGDGGGGGGNTDAPTISSFTATPGEPVAPNTDVTLAWVLTGSPTTVTITPEGGEATDVTGDSTLTVTPAVTTTYTLNASNAAGAADPQTVTVTVQGEDDNGGVNAADDTADTTPGEPVTVDVLANDEPGADALIIVAATSPQQGGTVQISRDSKSITYTPKEGFTGEDTFSYTVRDADLNKSSAKVTVQVGPAD